MIELRWKIEEWAEYRDGLSTAVKHSEKPVLQFRTKDVHVDGPTIKPAPKDWSAWEDVPTVRVET